MIYRLIFLTGSRQGQKITVEKSPMTFGHAPACSVVLADDEIAAEHAVVEHKTEGLHIRDLGSMNRILVNGREIREAWLRHGDEVEIGRTHFLVQAVVPAEVAAADEWDARRRKRLRAAGWAAAVALVLWGGWLLLGRGRPPDGEGQAQPAGAVEPEVTNAAPAAAVSPTDQIERLHKDIVDIQQTVRELASRPPAPTNLAVAPTAVATPASATTAVATGGPPPAARTNLARSVAESARLAPAAAAPRRPAHRIRIAAHQQRKLPDSDDYAEMRVVTVGLQADQTVDPAAVRVDVSFFDRRDDTGETVLTRAVVPRGPLRPDAAWPQAQDREITSSYTVPKAGGVGRPERYYGYAVRVFHRGELQDTAARPPELLNHPALEAGGGGGARAAGPAAP
jgi:hypothetical protein